MKYLKTKIVIVILAVLMGIAVFPIQPWAAQRCTLTFRAGNVGSFDVEKVTASIKENTLVSVQPEYIKLEVGRGQKIQNVLASAFGRNIHENADVEALFLSFLSPNSSYRMREVSTWGLNLSDVIKRNTEYVIDYGMLVDPVPYRISYVEKDSGEEIAAPVISYGNEGEEITARPVGVDAYETTDVSKTIRLQEDQENEVTFYYQYIGLENVEKKTQYRTEYRDVTRLIADENQTSKKRPEFRKTDSVEKQKEPVAKSSEQKKNMAEETETETTISEQEVPLQAKDTQEKATDAETDEKNTQEFSVRELWLLFPLLGILVVLLFRKKRR